MNIVETILRHRSYSIFAGAESAEVRCECGKVISAPNADGTSRAIASYWADHLRMIFLDVQDFLDMQRRAVMAGSIREQAAPVRAPEPVKRVQCVKCNQPIHPDVNCRFARKVRAVMAEEIMPLLIREEAKKW